MMTAQWTPWFAFALHGRVPTRAFTPRPGVDGGILTLHRRGQPLVPTSRRHAYQGLVHRVFTGPGRGLGAILARATPLGTPRAAAHWLAGHGLDTAALPGTMSPEAWADLFTATETPPRRGTERKARRSPRM